MKKALFSLLTLLIVYPSMAQEKPTIQWLTIQEAMELHRENPKKVIIDVYTDWCGWCKRMDVNTFANEDIAKYISENYYAVKLNAEMKDTIVAGEQVFVNEKPNEKRHPHQLAITFLGGKMSYPSIVYFDESFNLIQAVPGYQSPESLEPILYYISESKYKTETFEDFQKNFKSQL